MIKELFITQLTLLQNLFPCTNALVVGSGKGEYIDILNALDIENVTLVDADEQQIEKMLKLYNVPSSYKVENALIYKDQGNVEFNIATNSTLNCVKGIDNYRNVMPNVTTSKVKIMQSYSLDTFLENRVEKKVNWALIDTFTAIEILTEVKKTFQTLEVVVCKVLVDKAKELQKVMFKNGFKLVNTIDENNPRIKLTLYVKDYKQREDKLKNEFELQKNKFEKLHSDLENSISEILEREKIIYKMKKLL